MTQPLKSTRLKLIRATLASYWVNLAPPKGSGWPYSIWPATLASYWVNLAPLG